MTTYLGSVACLDLVCSKAAANDIWQFIAGSNVDHGDESNIIATMWVLHSSDEEYCVGYAHYEWEDQT